VITTNHPWSEYVAFKKMNASTIVQARHSMRRLLRVMREGFKEQTDAMRTGSGLHALLLEPQEFEQRFVVMPDFHLDEQNLREPKRKDEPLADRRTDSKATKYYKAQCQQFYFENQGKEVLTRSEYDRCLYAIEQIHSRPEMVSILERCGRNKEITVEGVIDDVEFKGRIDFMNPEWLGDLKSCRTVEKRKFGYSFTEFSYAHRMAIYRELIRQNTNTTRKVCLICQEVDGDFDNALVEIPGEVLDDAFDEVRNLVAKYKACLEYGVWPGVDGGSDWYELELPPKRFDDKFDWGSVPVESEQEEAEAYF